jgi:hypothetical protein
MGLALGGYTVYYHKAYSTLAHCRLWIYVTVHSNAL